MTTRRITTKRRIAVIGAGTVGSHLARGLSAAGHDVVLGVRDPEQERAGLEGLARATPAGAAAGADAVVLAVPAAALAAVVPGLGLADGAVVVDATNAVGVPVPDGHDTLGALVADLAPGAAVVKAFNTIGGEHLESATIDGRPAFLPVAGDDRGRPLVVELAGDLGFEVADLGGPDAIRLVEDAARLWIHLAIRCSWGREFAFGVLRP
jgi:8-hydroxy-5-deazaflavin:NADPH oxidoreductase